MPAEVAFASVVAVAVVVGVVGVAAATLLVGMAVGVDVGGSAVVWLGSLLGTKRPATHRKMAMPMRRTPTCRTVFDFEAKMILRTPA